MYLADFEVLAKLGEGSFSQVLRVRRISDTHEYALKVVKFLDLNSKERINALNEIRILASIDHPNIICYKEAFINPADNTLW
jgi:NIMA (never in mitosis gene a)-related kinase